MNSRLLVSAVALAAVLALPATALAKGASEATIDGPGLKKTIVLGSGNGGGGELGNGTPLANLAEETGFYPAVFGQSPDPMRSARPKGDLGPRYTITWVMPGPSGKATIRQDVYPYAAPLPITYVKPGQPFWNGEQTRGGWFTSAPFLRDTLVRIGLPAQPVAAGDGSVTSDPGALAGIALGVAAALLAAAFAVFRLRRRPGPATA